eukprot:scaffold61318_cov54-Attheya_sp.AAC.2
MRSLLFAIALGLASARRSHSRFVVTKSHGIFNFPMSNLTRSQASLQTFLMEGSTTTMITMAKTNDTKTTEDMTIRGGYIGRFPSPSS